MTAEVGILNRVGVALAADSAATVITAGGAKIYNANKLFALSKYYPVGIMVYGNAAIHGVPWEVIIKEYRRKLGQKSFASIDGYCKNFIAYLNGNHRYFSPKKQTEYFLAAARQTLYEILRQIDSSVKEFIRSSQNISTVQVRKIVRDEISRAEQFSKDLKRVSTLSAAVHSRVRQKYRLRIDKLINSLFVNFKLTHVQKSRIRDIIFRTLLADNFDSGRSPFSGIVFAGFGENEIFPAIREFYIDFVIEDRLKFKESDRGTAISEDNSAGIVPFAQKDMVDTFMCGRSSEYRKRVVEEVSGMMSQFSSEVSGKSDKKALSTFKKTAVPLLDKCFDNLRSFEISDYIMPVLDSVQFLSLDELATMAESLVNLTSFKRRVSLSPETVGEPIDVAVISKGDGFIWINRKEYFKAERNPQFSRNYYYHEDRK